MLYGFVKCAAITNDISVADFEFNSESIIEKAEEAAKNNTEIAVFPELCITGYTCGDLFLQRRLINGAKKELIKIAERTKELNMLFAVGLPFEYEGQLYNCAAVIFKGRILGIVPKSYIPNYNEFYEKRHFTQAFKEVKEIEFNGETVLFGTNILFINKANLDCVISVEICEDLWTSIPPSCYHAMAGATIILNLSAGNEITGKDVYRKSLVENQSARLLCSYLYCGAGEGESTTDVVFSAHNIICENGKILAESKRFKNGTVYGDIDIEYLIGERRRNSSFKIDSKGYKKVYFELENKNFNLIRNIDKSPFVPSDEKQREKRCEEIISIQAMGLKKRISHIGTDKVVIGISGGLDSTHALIVTKRAFEMLGLDTKGIITVTMPCFGTSGRTYNNAVKLCRQFDTSLIEINIKEAVMNHFKDIGHDPDVKNLTYENSQARERTQILMDISSKYGGFVVGTGDLSELALGFATYNGDHMSMYGVNASVPKTLIRFLIKYYADYNADKSVKDTLYDILDTPVSPELLPPKEDDKISQVTEDIVGPYILHDFFLFNMLRCGFEPEKIFKLAQIAFKGEFDDDTILKWLKIFYKRFFSQQYKRSCMPDGPKVGSVSLSPRGDLRMPSDASVRQWINWVL